MNRNEKINYIELPAKSMDGVQTFFSKVFNWTFEKYGDNYMAFSNAGIDGGFYQSDLTARADNGSALVIFYSANIEKNQAKIEQAGGAILKPVFSFPGGRRFHFTDPNGNEYAVWSDCDADGQEIV